MCSVPAPVSPSETGARQPILRHESLRFAPWTAPEFPAAPDRAPRTNREVPVEPAAPGWHGLHAASEIERWRTAVPHPRPSHAPVDLGYAQYSRFLARPSAEAAPFPPRAIGSSEGPPPACPRATTVPQPNDSAPRVEASLSPFQPASTGFYFTPLANGGFGPSLATTSLSRSPARAIGATGSRTSCTDNPVLSCTLWEDERCVVVQVIVEGHVVARRTDTDWVNATKLLNMVGGLSRGKRDMYLKNEPDRLVFRRGALHLKGVWLPLDAAKRLAREHGLYDRLYPLFEQQVVPFLLEPVNLARTAQLVETARARSELLDHSFAAADLTASQAAEVRRRDAVLERVLQSLEAGLGVAPAPRAAPAWLPCRISDSCVPPRTRPVDDAPSLSTPLVARPAPNVGPTEPAVAWFDNPTPPIELRTAEGAAALQVLAHQTRSSPSPKHRTGRRTSVASSSASELSSLGFTPLGGELLPEGGGAVQPLGTSTEVPRRRTSDAVPLSASLRTLSSVASSLSLSLSQPISGLRVTSSAAAGSGSTASSTLTSPMEGSWVAVRPADWADPDEAGCAAELREEEEPDERPSKKSRIGA
ncbi:hypothetical protein JCM8202_002322 [Rhodotorula sphaerocarpa]